MAAPICATSLADPSRSSLAMSEACRLAGTARDEEGMAAAASLAVALALRLQHSPCHFLNEERDAVSALDNVLPNVLGEQPCCR